MFLPEKIRNLVADENYDIDNVGMSDSSVLIYGNKVLKVQEYNEEAENEYRMLRYLQGKWHAAMSTWETRLRNADYLRMV